MTPLALGLVLLSALLHVVWNSMAKANADKEAFAWLTSIGGLVFLLLFYLVGRIFFPGPPMSGEAVKWAALSACFQTAYIILLFAAYALIDLSVVYPVNRGFAPILVMLAAGALVGDGVTPLQGVGVACAAFGAMAVGLTNKTSQGAGERFSPRGLPLCILTAAATAGYIITDRKAMGAAMPPRALDYLFLVYVFQGVGLTLWMLIKRPRLAGFYEAFRRDPRSVTLVSLFIPLSYLCIVAALSQGNVTLISAGRNVGILFSALAGRYFLAEKVTGKRAAGAFCVFAGLVLITLPSG